MAGRKSILVVEDDATIVDLIQAVLTDEGYDVRVARNGDDAVRADHHPALVVMDLYVPGASGSELVQRLHAAFGQHVPILLISASSVNDEGQAIGAYEYLPKPFDLDDLLAAVSRGLDGAQPN